MPESNAAAKRRLQKANRAAGIGDEQGRLVRMKDPPKLMKCTICQLEMKITKTNTELISHATHKHNNAALEECFPGATAISAELAAAVAGKGSNGNNTTNGGGLTKKQTKAKVQANMDDLLNAGLGGGSSGGKKKGK